MRPDTEFEVLNCEAAGRIGLAPGCGAEVRGGNQKPMRVATAKLVDLGMAPPIVAVTVFFVKVRDLLVVLSGLVT